MPRKPLFRSNLHPYHVVNQVNNREWFHLDPHATWKILTDELYAVSSLYDARIHGFIMMSNHYHLMVSTPNRDLDKIMKYFGENVTAQYNAHTERVGHLFRGRYKHSLISDSRYYSNVLKYVYRNPVRAGICGKVEEYPFSSLYGLLGKSHLPMPIVDTLQGAGDVCLPQTLDELVAWLNFPTPKEHYEAIRKGLRKAEFALSKDNVTRKPLTLESYNANLNERLSDTL